MGSNVTAEEAFKIVEIELGFLYDVLYTKIPIVLSRHGVILRCICLSFTVSTLIAFLMVVGKHGYSKVDIGISYLLMVGAIFLEIYSAILHLSSDRGIIWLTSQNNRFLEAIGSKFLLTKPKGIRSMAQHSLLAYCLQPRKLKLAAVLNIFDPEDNLEKYIHTSWKDVNPDLQKIMYSHLLKKRKKYEEKQFDFKCLSELLDERGYNVLGEINNLRDTYWSVSEAEFTHSVLLWHIATDFVYHDDHLKFRAGSLGPHCEISKLLSDYMMYLLFLCPAMLPEGIGNIRHQHTCIEAKKFFGSNLRFREAIGALSGIDFDFRSFFVEMGNKRKSAFFEGYLLANQLKSLISDFHYDHKEIWDLIAQVWLEMLTYAASQCSWKEHVRQLQQGEELLTQVALLMAHLGLSKKINLVPLTERLQQASFKPSWHWDKLDRLAYYLA